MNKIINIDPEILSGTPVFTGTRVPVKKLFDYLETDETLETFLDDFPSVKREQALSILEIAEKISFIHPKRSSMKILLDECLPRRVKGL